MRTMDWITQHLLLPLTLALVTAAPGLLYPTQAGATETLDQSQPVSMSPATVSSSAQKAQIFTAGLYGCLDRVSLRLENYTTNPPDGAVLTISVQTVIGGLPSGKQIGSGTIPLGAIPPLGNPDWVDVSIRGAVVHAGTQYALVLQTSNVFGSVTWWYAYTSYAGGEMAFNDGTAWRMEEGYDFTFQTYVMPDALDQQQHAQNGGTSGITLAQTFTPGVSGVIDRVRVWLQASWALGSLEASIQTVTGGYPSGIVLGLGSVPVSSIPTRAGGGWVPIGISSAAVAAGTQYALVLRVGQGAFAWWLIHGDVYPGGEMLFPSAQGWTVNLDGYAGTADAAFETYVATPVVFATPPPPPLTNTPCSSGVCPAVTASITPKDSPARVTSLVHFQERRDGTVHGILNFDDSKTGNFVLRGCVTDSAACRLTVTTFACTDQHAIKVAGTYTRKGETAGDYLLTLSGTRGGIGTFTLTADHSTYTLTHNGIVDVTCPPGAGVIAGQR